MSSPSTPIVEGEQAPVTRRLVLSGVLWKLLRQAVSFGSQLVVVLILARLLTPRDFGLAAMVLAFGGVVALLTDLSFGGALIQRPTLTEADRSTAFWTSLGAGTLFGIVAVLASGLVADFYGEPRVRWLFAAFGLAFWLEALSTTQGALLTRELRFRQNETRIILATLVGAVVSIALAALGAGPWALIGQTLTAAAASTLLLWRVTDWRPRRIYSLASLRDLGGFAGNVFAARALWLVNRNTINLLLGRAAGSAALGIYTAAWSMTLAPLTRIAIPIQSVFFPTFSRLRDPAQIGEAWMRANRLVAAVTMPGLLGLLVVAPEFVAVVLGPRWHETVPVIRVLAYVGIIQALQAFNAAILSTVDRTGTLLRAGVIVTAATITAYAIGVRYGLVAVAVAYAISNTIVEPWVAWLTMRAIDLSAVAVLRSLAGVTTAALLMAAGVFAAQQGLVLTSLPTAARLALEILIGIALYVPLCFWRAPQVVEEVRRMPADLRGARTMPLRKEVA